MFYSNLLSCLCITSIINPIFSETLYFRKNSRIGFIIKSLLPVTVSLGCHYMLYLYKMEGKMPTI